VAETSSAEPLPEVGYEVIELLDRRRPFIIISKKPTRASIRSARVAAYTRALDRLAQTPGWDGIDQDRQQKLAAPLERGKTRDQERVPIPQLRSELDACETRLQDAVAELHRLVDGDRVATVRLGGYFSGGIETEEQLDAALAGIREECSRLIGTGKKVIVQ